jgi:hypothetical protein
MGNLAGTYTYIGYSTLHFTHSKSSSVTRSELVVIYEIGLIITEVTSYIIKPIKNK